MGEVGEVGAIEWLLVGLVLANFVAMAALALMVRRRPARRSADFPTPPPRRRPVYPTSAADAYTYTEIRNVRPAPRRPLVPDTVETLAATTFLTGLCARCGENEVPTRVRVEGSALEDSAWRCATCGGAVTEVEWETP